jgi:hypothetical protein
MPPPNLPHSNAVFPKDVLLPPPLVSFAMFVEAVPFVVSAGWQGRATEDGENCSESALHFGFIFVGQQLEDGRAVPAKPLVGVELNPGPTYCHHGRQKNKCKDCGGRSICQHGRQKSLCKDCGGSSICQHGRQKNKCKDCGGSGVCEHGKQRGQCKDCQYQPMVVLSGTAAAVPRRYYPDRESYRLLDEYAVADGCLESEVMQQISCDVNGDFLFENVFDTSDASRQPIPYAAPLHSNRCLNHNAVVFSHAPPRPIQSAGSILQSPSSTVRLWLRRPCSASCARRGSCGCSCCVAPLCHILLLPHLYLVSPLTRLSRSYPTYYSLASTL